MVRVAQEVDYSRHVRGGGYGFYTVGTFEVVQWVKGARGRSRFMLHSYPALTDCSSDYPISLYGLSPGDRLVMFARRGRLGMATLIDLLTQQQALDPATLALFGEARP